mgnify:CR=1 FL=1
MYSEVGLLSRVVVHFRSYADAPRLMCCQPAAAHAGSAQCDMRECDRVSDVFLACLYTFLPAGEEDWYGQLGDHPRCPG